MTASDRRLPFDGATNFRDLGGYATFDGGSTRWGLVYRADGLHALSAADVERIESLRLRAVFDLRRDSERVSLPNRVPSVAMCVMTPVDAAGVKPIDRTTVMDRLDGECLLRTMYGNMLRHSAPVFGRLLVALAEPDGLPAAFHCHGGKDRTGLAAAILLEGLGVDRRTVLDDYELTSVYRQREHQEDSYQSLVTSGLAPEAAAAVLGAPRWVMVETLEELDDEYGGVEGYLTGFAGLDRSVLDRLRRRLVTPPSEF